LRLRTAGRMTTAGRMIHAISCRCASGVTN
jgi:hypothetical protein